MKLIKLLVVALVVMNLFTDVLSRHHRSRRVRKNKTLEDLSDSIKLILGAVSILTRNIYNKETVGRSHLHKECHGVYDEQEYIKKLKSAIDHYQMDTSDISSKVFSDAFKLTMRKPDFKTQLDKCLLSFGTNYYSSSLLEIMEVYTVVDGILKAKNLSFIQMLSEGHIAVEKIRREKHLI